MSDFFRRDSDTKLKRQADKETSGDCRREPPPWSLGDQLGDFILEELLGSGGSGFVYRVWDVATRRRGAIKLLRRGNPDLLVRNRLGFRRMMHVEHPNLLRVDRIYKLGDYTALSMEEVKGVTFADAVKELRSLPHEQAFLRLLSLLRDFAAGLAAMHSSGSIHRDIKPENLMVGDDGRGRVIDYGLVDAFDLDEATTVSDGFMLGTPQYMSPEVIFRQRYLPAGDIFSLGMVMLEAMQVVSQTSANRCDAVPNVARNETAQIDARSITDAIDELSSDVPEMISEACREMLERHPGERPTAAQLMRLGLPAKAMTPSAMGDVMIGRGAQVAEIRNWIDAVFCGSVSRLHITGPSGIGKTRLLDEMIDYIESKHWGQVFRGRCRLREDSALQAFEQICDAIASRYMRADRGPLSLTRHATESDPNAKLLDRECAGILCSIFPVLQTIFDAPVELPPSDVEMTRLDSLEAAVRLSVRLRDVGPLFVVIDDAQWADRDSLNVLDRLQTAGGDIGLGIITVSRESSDPQQITADQTIALGPIALDAIKNCLATAAARWAIPISQSALTDLAEATGGSPLRLREFANEFRPDGALSQLNFEDDPECSVNELVSIDHLWKYRLQRLSKEAKSVLLFVVTAGGRVSTEQLGQLTGQGDAVDAAVSELSQLRLITDEATGGECIAIFHDRFADHVTDSLGEKDKRDANQAWASLLVRRDEPERLAARIAGHWFAAGQPGRAVSHAILAAEDADRRIAPTEAARWHARVIDHVAGEEKTHHIRQAARRYHAADTPVEAAKYYQMLSRLVAPDERFNCQLLVSVMLLRCGQFQSVREQLGGLAPTLDLPRPKSAFLSKLSILMHCFRLSMQRKSLMESLIEQSSLPTSATLTLPKLSQPLDDWATSNDKDRKTDRRMTDDVVAFPDGSPIPDDREDHRNQQRFDLCVSLVRPMTMFDTVYAAELNLAAARLARKQGTLEQRIHVAVGESVFGSYDKGSKRVASLSNLLTLIPIADRSGSDQAKGDVWAGLAYAHALSCRWEQVERPMVSSVESYRRIDRSHGFEIAHVCWLGLWADWNMGRWKSMLQLSDNLFEEASRRNDLFQQQITYGGFGGNAWLVRDRSKALERMRTRDLANQKLGPGELLSFFDRIVQCNIAIYDGKFDDAWKLYGELRTQGKKLPFDGIQCFRIARQGLGALIGLHCNQDQPNQQWVKHVRRLTLELRSEQIRYARIMADFFDALLHRQIADSENSEPAVKHAREVAVKLFELTQTAAKDANLRPIQLASADELAAIETGHSAGLLRERMIAHGVVAPERLALLYTVRSR